jgi:hypothetical protein
MSAGERMMAGASMVNATWIACVLAATRLQHFSISSVGQTDAAFPPQPSVISIAPSKADSHRQFGLTTRAGTR